MAQMEIASKSQNIADFNHTSTSVLLGLEGFAHKQRGIHTSVEAHQDAIQVLTKHVQNLDSQVKAIARLLATQDPTKVRDERNEALAALRTEMTKVVTAKVADVAERLNKEVRLIGQHRLEAKNKLDSVEASIIEHIATKIEEQIRARVAFEEEIKKVAQQVTSLESLQKQSVERLTRFIEVKQMDMKQTVTGMKNELIQDRQTYGAMVAKHEEEQLKLKEWAIDTLRQGKHEVDTRFRELEASLLARQARTAEGAESASRAVTELEKATGRKFKEVMADIMEHVEKLLSHQEADLDRKVVVVGRQMMELRKGLDSEKAARENDVNALKYSLADEKRLREGDEDRIIGMITQCMHSLDKLHRTC